ncbi:nucleotidyltransferase domain-containing protein [Saccharopolyspora sp. NFXS83]|uniref:nucleotidyltransferase domain-containing protein n=1 Tax=Saccharopolyspora sp. NFXS83 TaxID=2993560 RepID=UPI00224B3716|nr:nucleotidyltransferase domain-containing protein [Saccharopolyspora sp. NFXS83]MCX2729776.1 nucleotidyltransferase domain-containing protein [Saccharopolyspora sp. NFXS83]
MPFPLEQRVNALRARAEADPRIEAVLLYGSYTIAEADEFSDIEAYLFIDDESLPDFDVAAFLGTVAEIRLASVNQHGVNAVIFDDLMRGEFHAEAASSVDQVRSWRGMIHLPDPDRAVLLDRTGGLTDAAAVLTEPHRPEPAATARQLVDDLTNWTLMAANLLARGETARGHALLTGVVAPFQLRLCRLLRGTVDNWLTPSRRLEHDLTTEDYARHAATTSRLVPDEVTLAARESWQWTRSLSDEAARRWEMPLDQELFELIAARLA